ncbi:hypothetical protein NGH63_02205 [Staphylococcus xylosus]|uniref:hypothetical protein n=1 Tax=Staphylococcus xylosus TaxID=1288 RepID=UPI002DB56C9C|nr:hypothetical protein [Staphylococcus xylosus]MEB8175275.1 hypothetical protein [Staphylococcus xylosus]
MNVTKESISVLLSDGQVHFFNDRLNTSKMGTKDYNEAKNVIPELDDLTEGYKKEIEVSNNKLRELGMNARPIKEPIPPFTKRKR